METKDKLNQLAEFMAQKTLIEMDKLKLLNEVKVPEEVQETVKVGMQAMADVEKSFAAERAAIEKEHGEKLSTIVIPEEIKEILADIDRQRTELAIEHGNKQNEIYQRIADRKQQIQAEIDAQVKGVYDAVATRKREIEAEFSGKIGAADENIEKLTAEIKAEVVVNKKTIKGDYFQAIYMSGRITWNTDKMEAWRVAYPFLDEARKEGAPSVTIRKI